MRLLSRTNRRQFLCCAMAASEIPARFALGQTTAGAIPLPARAEVLVRGGHVMTMDPTTGDIAGGDVHVHNGAIVAVGRGLAAPGAEVIDSDGMIVLPGLVETHWHMWNTLLRSMAVDEQKFGYFPTSAGLGQHYLPSDMYQGTRLSAAEALNAGITFVHDGATTRARPSMSRRICGRCARVASGPAFPMGRRAGFR